MGKTKHSHSHASGSHKHDHDHGHSHFHSHLHSHQHAPKVITQAIGVTLIFMAIELIGGLASNSLALISDAAHMMTDVGAMLLSLFAIWVSRRPTTLAMSFGYHRAEIIGALLSGLLIWVIAGVLIYEAIVRIQSPPEVKGPIVFIVATIGLAANFLCMKMLHSTKDENLNVRAAYLHLLSDALGSIGAIIAGVVLWLTDWRLIDPIVTFLFSGLMLVSSWTLVKEAIGILMESTPTHVNPTQVMRTLEAVEGVQEAHDLHIWSVSNGRLALSVHLIAKNTEFVLKEAHRVLQKKYGIIHTTIQVEHPEKFQSERCYDCSPLEVKQAR